MVFKKVKHIVKIYKTKFIYDYIFIQKYQREIRFKIKESYSQSLRQLSTYYDTYYQMCHFNNFDS